MSSSTTANDRSVPSSQFFTDNEHALQPLKTPKINITARCICKSNTHNGSQMILCKTCSVWQHSVCMLGKVVTSGRSDYRCERCAPGHLDHLATTLALQKNIPIWESRWENWEEEEAYRKEVEEGYSKSVEGQEKGEDKNVERKEGAERRVPSIMLTRPGEQTQDQPMEEVSNVAAATTLPETPPSEKRKAGTPPEGAALRSTYEKEAMRSQTKSKCPKPSKS